MNHAIQKYKVTISHSAKLDIKERKQYILQQFKYRELAENFSSKIKKAALQLAFFPHGHEKTGFQYRGYDIYIKPKDSHLIFYTINESLHTVTVLRVLQEGMNWKHIIRQWIKEHKKAHTFVCAFFVESARRRMTSGGRQLCADRSGAKTSNLRVQDWTRKTKGRYLSVSSFCF